MAAAFLRKRYKKGFILTEEALLKIDELIRKRLSSEAAAEMEFSALREDGMLLEYTSPSDLIEEENSPRNRITRITIDAKSPSGRAELDFDFETSVSLKIDSNVRDIAYLLYSDLKEYLAPEVLRFPLAVISPRVYILFVPFVAVVFPLELLFGIPKPDPIKVAAALQSPSVQEKLNWIIEDTASRSDTFDFKFTFAISALVCVAILLVGPFIRWLFPHNIFSWGKCAAAYERRKDFRSKFFWGVIVALVIGVAATAAYEKIRS